MYSQIGNNAENSKPKSFSKILFVALALLQAIEGAPPTMFPVLLENIRTEIAMSDIEASLIATAYMLISAFGMLFFGYLSDKYSRKKLILATGLGWFLGCLYVYFLCWNYLSFLGAAILFAIGVSCITPASASIIADISEPERRATIYAFMNLLLTVGGGIGVIIGFVALSLGVWRIAYLLSGLFGGCVLILWPFLREPMRGSAEKELRDLKIYEYRITLEDFKSIFRHRTVRYILLQTLLMGFPIGIMNFWLFSFFIRLIARKSGVDPSDPQYTNPITIAALAIAVPFALSSLAGQLFFSNLGDRYHKRGMKEKRAWISFWTSLLAIPLTASLFFLAYYAPLSISRFSNNFVDMFSEAYVVVFTRPANMVLFIIAIMSTFIGMGPAANAPAISTDVVLPEMRSTVSGITNFLISITTGIAPFLGSLVATFLSTNFFKGDILFGYCWTITIFYMFNIGVTIFWYMITRTYKIDSDLMHSLLETRAKESKNKEDGEK